MCFLHRNHGWVCLLSLLVNPEAALGSYKSSWIKYKVNSPHSCYCHFLFVHLPISAPYDFVLMCGKFCRIPNHQHRVGTHAPSLCARRFLVDAMCLPLLSSSFPQVRAWRSPTCWSPNWRTSFWPWETVGHLQIPDKKSWILMRQAMSFTLLVATKNSSFWASIARLITSLTLKYSELARRNNPSPEHCNEWMIPSSNLVFWADLYIPPNSTQLPRYTDVAFERLRASSEDIDFQKHRRFQFPIELWREKSCTLRIHDEFQKKFTNELPMTHCRYTVYNLKTNTIYMIEVWTN